MSFIYSRLTSFFQDKSHRNGGEKLTNGQTGGSNSWSKQASIPSVEITGSPIHRKIQKAASIGSISGLSEDSRSLEDGRASLSGSRKGDVSKDGVESITSPSRKATEALKKVRRRIRDVILKHGIVIVMLLLLLLLLVFFYFLALIWFSSNANFITYCECTNVIFLITSSVFSVSHSAS